MEVVEVCTKSKCHPPSLPPPARKSTICPNTYQVERCTRKYIQPPRIPSYAPKKIHRPPSKPFDANTTYHVSYLNTTPHYARTKSIKPTPILQTVKDKFQDDTTNRLSYQPVREMVKAKPFIPRQRKLIMQGPMETITTVREDFGPKHVERPGIILPSGNIRFCSGPMDTYTTSAISFVDPGFVRPPVSFKPSNTYSPPDEPTAKETTHMLSYQPFRIEQRETYTWAQKPTYKPPQVAMNTLTTYSKSYTEMGNATKVKPILPMSSADWLRGNREFYGKTCYNDAYVPRSNEPKVIPVIPNGNIVFSDRKMASDTTNKLSYQSVYAEKRKPFRPKHRNMISNGAMQSTTTNRLDYQFKMGERPEIVIPCNNIQHSNKPLEGSTTSALAYMNHGFIPPPPSCKPSTVYTRSLSKLDADTVNKLSYQPWTLAPKEIFPWAKKTDYQRPKEPMTGDSIYNMSFAPPGYFIEECENTDSPCIPNHHVTMTDVCSNKNCISTVKS